jgi:FkbM family methyltransferase
MNTIFDIGAHTGRDSEFYLKKGFKVVAVEAHTGLCEQIESRLKPYIVSGQLVLINKAIHKRGGLIIDLFTHPEHDDWGTTIKEWNISMDDKIIKQRVDTITMSTLIAKYGIPYYCKIDIEGYDGELLRSMQPYEAPRYLSAELLTFNNIIGHNNPLSIFDEALRLGYNSFQLIDQSENHKTKCPAPSLEGEYIDYNFDGTCSGLFGRELPRTDWCSLEDVLMLYLNYFFKRSWELNKDGWYDLHCTRK